MTISSKTIIAFVLALFVLGCQQAQSTSDSIYSMTIEDHSQGYVFPTHGHYYEYSFTSNSEQIDDVKALLLDFYAEGVIITDSWYKTGSPSCHPPGSLIAMTVMVDPRFIVLLDSENAALLASYFTPVETVRQIFCGYEVTRHTLN